MSNFFNFWAVKKLGNIYIYIVIYDSYDYDSDM